MNYFPDLIFSENPSHNDFIARWYGSRLIALKEPTILEAAWRDQHVYRFLWLRTFHNPVAVRVNVNRDETSTLTVKVTDGMGGYFPGSLTTNESRVLTRDEVTAFLVEIEEVDYWNLPSRPSKTDPRGCDGSRWILEAAKGGNYHIVDRWSPGKGPMRRLGMTMLLGLARLPNRDIY